MCGEGGGSLQKLETDHERRSGPIKTHAPVDLARIIHDGSSRKTDKTPCETGTRRPEGPRRT